MRVRKWGLGCTASCTELWLGYTAIFRLICYARVKDRKFWRLSNVFKQKRSSETCFSWKTNPRHNLLTVWDCLRTIFHEIKSLSQVILCECRYLAFLTTFLDGQTLKGSFAENRDHMALYEEHGTKRWKPITSCTLPEVTTVFFRTSFSRTLRKQKSRKKYRSNFRWISTVVIHSKPIFS